MMFNLVVLKSMYVARMSHARPQAERSLCGSGGRGEIHRLVSCEKGEEKQSLQSLKELGIVVQERKYTHRIHLSSYIIYIYVIHTRIV